MRRGLVQKGRIGGRRIAAAQELAEAISQDRQREHGREKHHITRKRSEEHTSEHQSLMSTSYAVFCLKKKIHNHYHNSSATTHTIHLCLTYHTHPTIHRN